MPPPRTWPTAVEIAEDMRDALASQTGDPEIAAVRAMMDGLNRLPWGDTAELAAALERPGSMLGDVGDTTLGDGDGLLNSLPHQHTER